MTALAWVVGSGGLLGSHVRRAMEARPSITLWSRPGVPFSWSDPTVLEVELSGAVHEFVGAVAAGGYQDWVVLWCAGAGVIGSSSAFLEMEFASWEHFLARLGEALAAEPRTERLPGRIFLASSAGGVYGKSTGGPLTEDSPCWPISAYGSVKLRQERALEVWARSRPEVSTLVARISNLYGPGQKLDKPQGLISHMARCVIYGMPIHIYVPLDTIRDYLFTENAARAIVLWVERLGAEAMRAGKAHRILKICASEEETTISALIGVFRRMAKRQVRVISGLHRLRDQQPARLQFRSKVWTDEPRPATTSLEVGVSHVYRYQLALYQAGALPPPSALAGLP